MKVREVMTPAVATIGEEAAIGDAMRLMLDRKISGLPVVDAGGALIGIVTEGDLMRRAELATQRHRPRWLEFVIGPGRLASDYTLSHGRRVADVMTRTVTTIGAGASLSDAIDLMEKSRVKRLPVLESGRLVGILSRADVMRVFVLLQPSAAPSHLSDEQIERSIRTEINTQPWCPQSVLVTTRNGSAEISGVITDDRTRDALRVLVQNVPGVTRVVDRLVTVEPLSGFVVALPADVEKPGTHTNA